jgi:Fur family ferric uptake transcriptional regulator
MTHASRTPRRAFRDPADVARALREDGGRLSGPRRRVIEALFAAEGPVSAEYIAEGRGARSESLELTSVYRTLEHLEGLGVVRHVHIGHGPGLYALIPPGGQEYLACERCDRVTRVESARLDPVRAEILDRFGYHVRFSHFPMLGLCVRCAQLEDLDEAPRGDSTEGRSVTQEHDEHAHRECDVGRDHPHTDHDHAHVEHEHEHAHADRVHAHPHVHERELAPGHGHPH